MANPTFSLAVRLLLRELRSGRLLTMFAATLIAVTATVSVALLVERVTQIMVAESSALLAADLTVTSSAAAPDIAEAAQDRRLATATATSLRSVVSLGDKLQLVRLKAVSEEYPLRGKLRLAESIGGPPKVAAAAPGPGEVWADTRFFQLTGATPGSTIGIGASELKLTKVLVVEPDRGREIFSLAPRVMMGQADLAATQLIVPGSRATYTLYVAGRADALSQFRDSVKLTSSQKLHDPSDSRLEIRSTFLQAERFLTLAAFAGVILATIGIALAARAYCERHQTTVAIMKTMGLTSAEVARIIAFELFVLAVTAALLGNAVAFGLHQLLADRFLPEAALEATILPTMPFLHGIGIAVVILGGFALPVMWRLAQLPVPSILLHRMAQKRQNAVVIVVIGIVSLALVAPWHMSNSRVIALTLAGMLITALTVALAALALIYLLRMLGRRTALTWRFGLANVARRGGLSVTQCTALGLGLSILLLLGLVREDLLEQWQGRIPAGAPNQFLINIQPDETDPLAEYLGDQTGTRVDLYPMVRGRLSLINEREVNPNDFTDPRARRLADREHNLSSAQTLKNDNKIIAGNWWRAGERGQWSVEKSLADALGIELGDRLTFTVAASSVTGTVSSIREVDWGNFQVNFFIVGSPDLLTDQPATFITSFFLDPEDHKTMAGLVQRFPSVTAIDVEAAMYQVRLVMSRVSAALTWVFGFSIVAALLVLIAAIQSTHRERLFDVVLLKTLGAGKHFVSLSVVVEFVVLGAIAGTLGSLGAIGTGWALAVWVLQIPYAINWSIALTGLVATLVLVAGIGLIAALETHRHPVVHGLRRAR